MMLIFALIMLCQHPEVMQRSDTTSIPSITFIGVIMFQF